MTLPHLAVLTVALAAAACSSSPRLPVEGEVRDLLLAREKGLQKIGEELVAELAKAKVAMKLPECAKPGPECTAAEERQKGAIAAYEQAVKPRLAELTDSVEAYGLAARLVSKKDVALSTLIQPPCTRQTSMAQYYLEIREYSVSWGNAFVIEDGSEHSNVIIQFKVPYDDAEVRVIACFLTDGTPRKK